jgi:hypothetical protein
MEHPMASARPGPQSTDDGDTWTGLSSLAAQAAQVLEVSGQIASSGDASMLRESLQDGLGGLRAAIDYVIGQNGLDWDAVNRQRDRKRALYERHEDGTRTSSRSCQGSPVRSGGGGR